MKLLLLGRNGQVGWELERALAPLGELTAFARADADVADIGGLASLVMRERPGVIVNATAYTAVDRAESEPDLARQVNHLAVAELARLAKSSGCRLVHYSTDYVFEGNKAGPYREDDRTNPQSVYGLTKLAGEQAIADSGCEHVILRTSWVHAARGANFVRTILRLASERDQLRIVADQTGAPTSAELIADVTAQVIRGWDASPRRTSASSIYHLTASGSTSWHGFARFIVEEASRSGAQFKASGDAIVPIATEDYPLPARRPANSILDTTRLREDFGLTLPDWRLHARRTIAELMNGRSA